MLVPYPSYEMNQLPNRRQRATDRIINTFRLSVDECDRLWVIDMGVANGTTYGDPQLFVIDLNTDQVVRQFTVTANLRRQDGSTWFPALIADADPGSCDRAYAYLPDIGWGMVVYSFQDDSAWRLEHHYFYFDPLASIFNIGGIRLEWLDGVFGLALSARRPDGHRTLYFQSLASTRMFSVDTSVLQANRSISESFDEYRHLGHRPSGMQAASMAMDPVTGAVFYALVNQDAIGCWNPGRWSERHSAENSAVVAQDPVTLRFPSDVKVDRDSNLWVISDRMPLYRFRVRDFDVTDVNYRVFRASAADVVRGTVCERPFAAQGFSSGSVQNGGSSGSSSSSTTQRPRPRPVQQSNASQWNVPRDRNRN